MKLKRNKIVAKLRGGLGNQLFIYFTAYVLSKKNFDLEIDISFYKNQNLRSLSINFLPIELYNYKFLDFLTFTKLKEKNPFLHSKLSVSKNSNYVLDGYFQNEEYFKEHRDEIIKMFIGNEEPLESLKNTVAVHVRRGDYLLKKNKDFHGVLSLSYFNKSINYLKQKNSDYDFLFFSDDINFCKQNFKGDNIFFVEQGTELSDLKRMINCQHFIISNSSYSWWGAWLGEKHDSIIISPINWILNSNLTPAPKRWLKF